MKLANNTAIKSRLPPRQSNSDHQREYDIELLLDAERPVVQQRLRIGGRREIVCSLIKKHVRDEKAGIERGTPKPCKVVGQQQKIPVSRGCGHDHECGQDAPRAPFIKPEDVEATRAVDLVVDHA